MNTIPKMQVPKKSQIIHRRKGALYSQQGASLFADKKDLQIGDILQVIVSEKLKNDSKNTRALTKASNTALGGGIFSPTTDTILGNGIQKKVNKFNNTLGLGFNTSSENSFAGASTSKQNEAFTTTISTIIEQTYQNGNYFIKGSKELLIDGQKQTIEISGVIRPYDITPENTIKSEQLANLKIRYIKVGDENDSNHQGWGTILIKKIWPF
jgi:flagellar L-ring protein precursor FlgH